MIMVARHPASILAVDPGKTCGWAYCSTFGVRETFQCGQVPAAAFLAATELWFETVEPPAPLLVVVEQFVITQRTVKVTRQPDAMEVIGQLKEWAGRHDLLFRQQPAASAKLYASNAQLREWGLDTAGRPHARDATRHLVFALADECQVFLNRSSWGLDSD